MIKKYIIRCGRKLKPNLLKEILQIHIFSAFLCVFATQISPLILVEIKLCNYLNRKLIKNYKF